MQTAIFQHSHSTTSCDLENGGQGHHNLISSFPPPMMYQCQFGQNPSIESADTRSYAHADADIDAARQYVPPYPKKGVHNSYSMFLFCFVLFFKGNQIIK